MWIAVNTQANAEEIALLNLVRQGYECYCPKILRTLRHARKTTTVKRPLFPGYIFVKIELEKKRWRPIVSSRGVRSVVRFSMEPCAVPEEFIERLIALENADKLKTPSARERFKVGQEIRCYGTALHDFIGQIIQIDEKDRIWALMDMLGGKVRVCLSADSVIEA